MPQSGKKLASQDLGKGHKRPLCDTCQSKIISK